MEAYATVSDLEKRWKALSDLDRPRAEVLLTDASVMVAKVCADSGVTIDESNELQALTLTSVVCEMVKRAMQAPVDAPVTQFSQTAGPFTESGTYANPHGDLFFKDSELKRLGVKRQRMFSIRPTGGAANEG